MYNNWIKTNNKNMERVNTQNKWLYEKYVSYFFIYGFIGWIIEVILFLFQTKEFVNRGFFFLLLFF